VDLRPRSGCDLPGQCLGRLIEADGHRYQARRIHPAVRVVLDRRPQGPAEAPRMLLREGSISYGCGSAPAWVISLQDYGVCRDPNCSVVLHISNVAGVRKGIEWLTSLALSQWSIGSPLHG
jgi:hypothetical protein